VLAGGAQILEGSDDESNFSEHIETAEGCGEEEGWEGDDDDDDEPKAQKSMFADKGVHKMKRKK